MRPVDCDVHIRWKSLEEIAVHLKEPWRSRLANTATVYPHNGYPNPNGSQRHDAMPPTGGSPSSDPEFTVQDLIDKYDLQYAVLVGESTHLAISNLPDADWATALAAAHNDWLIERWLSADPRYLGSMFVAFQDPQAAANEIDRVGSHPQIVQVAVGSGARMPLGQRFYHPIYEAAQRNGLAIAIHPFNECAGTSGPPTAAGYPTYYLEYHTTVIAGMQAHLTSYICEGVFEKFPRLKLVLIEGGLGWLPGWMWRIDREWKSFRSTTPWVKRPPSEYLHDHVRLTTQPLDEPADPNHLNQILSMFPAEEILMFASDYPHWDFDCPLLTSRRLPHEMRDRILAKNACELYGLPCQTEAKAA